MPSVRSPLIQGCADNRVLCNTADRGKRTSAFDRSALHSPAREDFRSSLWTGADAPRKAPPRGESG